jgi:hypothetical protein
MNLFLSDKKLDRLIHLANSMRQSGEEKSVTEIVWKNVLNYMDNSGLDKEKQTEYLTDIIIYLEYTRKYNNRIEKFLGTPTYISFLGAITSKYFNANEASLIFGSATFVLVLGILYLKITTKNPYKSIIRENPLLLEMIEEMDEASVYIEPLKSKTKKK